MPPKANENIEPSNHRLTRSSKVIPIPIKNPNLFQLGLRTVSHQTLK
jgi:hypothetical protein